ncbi:MarR family winged helix-turn-helix transcriptional regulator [Agrococcus sp. SGAir0287]|uniref:MarR family winged helix-turn-helix transcriptional regulator n=1 Tax=Agrococcus sp. SGAir0287 TaxID=2070347 RepID=UPI0010CD2AD6|nr:MarR family transcriptional regulator [Agrococcus sp. SGAir0287]QCR18442.1 MarR family transcriptional regulator [Agrococcus sp. SGAir0287]
MGHEERSEASGYWYPERDGASTVDVLNLLRRYRAAETRMRARTRASMEMGETDLLALRTMLAAQRRGELVRQRDLASVLGITSASVTVLVDRLEQSGHVERRPHPTDRRSTVVVATTATDHEVRETLGAMHQRMIAVVDDLTAVELEVVARFLSGMAAAVEEASDLDAELRDVMRDDAGD